MSSDPFGKTRDPFLEYFEAVEGVGPQTTLFELLEDAGVPLPDPDAVSDSEMTQTLWTVIDGLADLKVILYSTNHLDDRTLYAELWRNALRVEHPIVPPGFEPTTHLDIEGFSTDDEIYLKYYADDDERRQWQRETGKRLPDHVDPPYDRDHLLPGH